jgi:phosphoglycerate kinase
VTDDTRVRAAAPTITELADKGAKVLLLAHFGRPKGMRDPNQSLSLVLGAVEKVLGREVMFMPRSRATSSSRPWAFWAMAMSPAGKHPLPQGEEKNDPELVKAIAANGEAYVNDAFSAAHRAHASTEGLAHVLPAYAGRACRPNSKRWKRRWAIRSSRWRPWSAAPRCRPSSTCSSTSSRRSIT